MFFCTATDASVRTRSPKAARGVREQGVGYEPHFRRSFGRIDCHFSCTVIGAIVSLRRPEHQWGIRFGQQRAPLESTASGMARMRRCRR